MGLVSKKSFGVDKHILIANDSYLVSLPVVVGNSTVSADSNGRKILKAGTPLDGDITQRATAFTKTAGTTPVGVLLHDVDVTNGNANGTLVIAGCVDLLKMDSDVQALYTSTATAAMPRIIAVKGSAI